ncbi:hypothetical protein LuPra_05011 [Luteitalea pratensis]|uniref:Uncharacterized protein n=1 Tax=Luteitalea pratensis TaxID=1855912 RepID=A0A143PVD2_LUTPR|nr:hypothetical protein [Luteitalea pratensis]AMY11749.1 hypothetical protein LuPra_05011 [Luteitalea pratensis]
MARVITADTRHGSGGHRITTALLAVGLCACEGRPTSPTADMTPPGTASLSERLHATIQLIDDDDTPVQGAAVEALLRLGDAPRTATATSDSDGVATIELAVPAVEAVATLATVSVRREGFEPTRALVAIGRSPGAAQQIRVLRQLHLSPGQSLGARLFSTGPHCGIDEFLCRVVYIVPTRSGTLTIAVRGDDDRLTVDLEPVWAAYRRAAQYSLAVDAGTGLTVAVLGERDARFTVTATYDR